MLATEEEQNAHGIEHFRETLNQSQPPTLFTTAHYNKTDELQLSLGPILEKEVALAISKLKDSKTVQLEQIFAELLKARSKRMVGHLTLLLDKFWEG